MCKGHCQKKTVLILAGKFLNKSLLEVGNDILAFFLDLLLKNFRISHFLPTFLLCCCFLIFLIYATWPLFPVFVLQLLLIWLKVHIEITGFFLPTSFLLSLLYPILISYNKIFPFLVLKDIWQCHEYKQRWI